MSDMVRVQAQEGITLLTLDIPKTRNALSQEVLALLAGHLEALAGAADCAAIVLTGAGGHFCSGGDVSGMKEERTLPMARTRMMLGHRVIRNIIGGPKPVIAAVEGYAAGAGLSLAAACDYVVSSSTARYISSFAKVGLLPDMGLLWTLPQRIGLPEAKRMFATTRVVESSEAKQLGLVDQVVEPGRVLQTAIEIARGFTAGAPLATALMKAIYASGCATLEDALRSERDNQGGLYLTQDHRQAVAAFLEKRSPAFRGF